MKNRKKPPKTAKIRVISDDPLMVDLLISLVDSADGITPLEMNAEPAKGRGGKDWIGYQTVIIDVSALESLVNTLESRNYIDC